MNSMRRHTPKYFLTRAFLETALIGWMMLLLSAPAAPQHLNRYDVHKVEAAFIYNFIDFVTWPQPLPGSDHRLVIGILGDDHFGDAFAEVEGTNVLGRTLVVRKSDRLEDLMDSWILFISSSEAERVGQVLKTLRNKPILTVSDLPQFTRAGGMIEFYTAEVNGDTKVRFDINRDSVDRAGLRINFQLLSLARPRL